MSDKFPLALVISAVDQASAPIQKMTSNLKGVTATFAEVGKSLTMGLTAPLVGFAGVSFAAFSRFEAGMADVSTLIDTNVESMAELEKGVLAVTRAVKVQPLSEMSTALAAIRGAGISAADQFVVLEGSGKLAAAALGTTAEAADIATSAINAWGLQGEEARNIYNNVFQAVNTGKMTLSQLAQGFGGVAGTVASAGVKIDEYLASVAALTTTGLPAAEAHTQLRAVIAGLTRQTELTRVVFQRLGAKDLKELIAKSGGLVPALERVKGVLKGNDTMMLNLLGSTEALNAVIGLTGNQAGAFRQSLDTMRSGVDGLGGAFAKQSQTSKAGMQELSNSIEIAAISVGKVLAPEVSKLTPVIVGAAESWTKLGDDSKSSILVLGAGVAALGPTITVVTNLAIAFKALGTAIAWANGWAQYLWMMRTSITAALVPSLAAASKAVWGFTASLLANPITWIVIGVAAFAAAAYLVYKNWEPIKAFFFDLWDGIKSVVGKALAWVGEHMAWSPLGMIVNNWEPIRTFFADLWDGITEFFVAAWEKIKPIVDGVAGFFGDGKTTVNATSTGVLAPGAGLAPLDARSALPGPVQASSAHVTVDFANAPKGTRVTPAAGNTADLDYSLGWSMVTP